MTLRRFLLAVGLALLSGCVGPTYIVQAYPGEPRGSDTIAILRISGGPKPQIVVLDGERVLPVTDDDTRMHIEVLPGVHEIDANAPERGVRDPVHLRLDAKAGKVYRIEVRRVLAQGGAAEQASAIGYAYEVDRGSDMPIGPALAEPPR